MAGALIQLVALGSQDSKLTANPEISFFKSSYRPYVNFAMEEIEQSLQSTGFNRKIVADISRSGDLVLDMMLEFTLPALEVDGISAYNQATYAGATYTSARVQWVDNVANTMVKETTINIGGQDIDKHISEWYTIWNELTLPEAKREGYNDVIGQQNLVFDPVVGAFVDTDVAPTTSGSPYELRPGTVVSAVDDEAPFAAVANRFSSTYTVKTWGLQTPKLAHPSTKVTFVPKFWFNENPGLALPLIALQYHLVRFSATVRPLEELYILSADDSIADSALKLSNVQRTLEAKLWVNYVFLEAAERRITAKKSHEYLITQLQYSEEAVAASSHKFKLSFNHPCMELVWVVREDEAVSGGVYGGNHWNHFETYKHDFGQAAVPATPAGTETLFNTKSNIRGLNPFTKCKLQIHGQDRFTERDGDYFTRYQPFKYHTRVPKSKGIAVYSFSLNPESKQPNGTANFSRIDQPTLIVNFKQINSTVTGWMIVFARNVNLFRIAGGMGGIAFAS